MLTDNWASDSGDYRCQFGADPSSVAPPPAGGLLSDSSRSRAKPLRSREAAPSIHFYRRRGPHGCIPAVEFRGAAVQPYLEETGSKSGCSME